MFGTVIPARLKPPRKLTSVVLALVAIASALVFWATERRLTLERDAYDHALQQAALPNLAHRAQASLQLAFELQDADLLEDVARELLRRESQLKGIRAQLGSGSPRLFGDTETAAYQQTEPMQQSATSSELLLMGDWPIGHTPNTVKTLGTVTIFSHDPAGIHTKADVFDPVLPGALAALVLVASLLALWIRARVLRLCDAAAALSSGQFDAMPKISGTDEIAWSAQTLSDIGAVLREQVERVHGRNAALLRDVTMSEDRLERLASFASTLVAPLNEDSLPQLALETLARETDASIALLFTTSRDGSKQLTCLAAFATGGQPIDDPRWLAGAKAIAIGLATHTDAAPLRLNTLEADHPFMLAAKRTVPLSGVAAMPLPYRGESEGFVVIAAREPWSDVDLRFFQDSAVPMAIALANRRAYQTSVAMAAALEVRNDELIQQRDQLKIVDRLRNQFVANMSHELRTPLNAIVGYTELIADACYGPVNDEQGAALENVLSASNHLLELVNQVLDLSRAESGELGLHVETIDVRDISANVVRMATSLCRDKPYEPNLVGPSFQIASDGERVHQILTNLVGNAIKFTNEGFVTVDITPEEDGGVTLAVKDSGRGIDTDHVEMIFEEFRQVDGSSTRAHDGVGLGLAISRRLAAALGGALTVTSKPGKGSTFFLRLPAAPPERTKSDDLTPLDLASPASRPTPSYPLAHAS